MSLQLYAYFKKEEKNGSTFYHVSKPKKRVQHALGLKRTTLHSWIKKDASEPTECRKRGPKEKIDSFDKDVIARTLTKMLHENECVTLRKLKQTLKKEHCLNISKTSLWRQLKIMKYKFIKLKGGKQMVCETPRMVALRAKYLRTIREYRNQGYEIFYLDESYINAHHTFEKEWQSHDGAIKRNVPTGKGKRLIIAHCGSREKGLIEDGELIFESKSNDEHGDYHKDMNSSEFNNWVTSKVVPKFTKKSCLVMDNASYHNILDEKDKVPSRKQDIKDWLKKEKIPYSDNMLRPELYHLAKAHEKTKKFHIDKFLSARNHKCLRLPPYHPQLNPIELVWAETKRLVALNNTTFKLKDIKNLTKTALSTIDKDYWNKCEDHVSANEQGYWDREGLHFDQPSLIINMEEGSSDSD